MPVLNFLFHLAEVSLLIIAGVLVIGLILMIPMQLGSWFMGWLVGKLENRRGTA